METTIFTANFKKAFGNIELPIVFWYSSDPASNPEKTHGCFIKSLKQAREGQVMSLNAESISCPGGRVYACFTDAPPFIPEFVSHKERYKKTPEMVTEFIEDLNLPKAPGEYINFAPIDKVKELNQVEGVLFFATPDVLTGLVAWTLYDTNNENAVSVPFGSGCSSIISQVIKENRANGKRTFLGLFDPSVRPSVEANVLSLAIPMSRFKEMYLTMNECCLHDTKAWSKVKERINHEF